MKWFILVFSSLAYALPHTTPIPRSPKDYLTTETAFAGGSETLAALEKLRSAWHQEGGFERWVFDFSDTSSRLLQKKAPPFQVRFQNRSERPKLVIELSQVKKNKLDPEQLKALVGKSRFVTDIVVYPPIEEGELAIEFLLKPGSSFSPHQPVTNEGRLVLDFKEAEAKN